MHVHLLCPTTPRGGSTGVLFHNVNPGDITDVTFMII